MNTILTNVRTSKFKELHDKLPDEIQKLAKSAFKQFLDDPDHPSLSRHQLKNKKKSSHLDDSFSVSISRRYRSIYAVNKSRGRNIWYWIGSHSDYNKFTGGSG